MYIAERKAGRQRLIPVSGQFFAALAAYMDAERPPGAASDRVFLVLRVRAAPTRCQPRGCMRS